MHPARTVEADITAYYKESVSKSTEHRLSSMPGVERGRYKRRLKQLHPSSFPYCGYKHAYESMVAETDPVVYGEFSRDYFLGVGSLAHEILQKWLGTGGRIAGNWKCVKCEHVHTMCVHPTKCGECGHEELNYEEVGGRWGKYIWWHKDGIFIDKKGKKWIIDYKTSSSSAIWEHKKNGTKFPYISNRVQAESYVVLAEDAYEEKIEGWILFYVSRDFPTYNFVPVAQKMTQERKDEVRARLTRDDAQFSRVLRLPDNPELLGVIRKNKLCEDKEFYKTNVHDQYRPCPIWTKCFVADKAKAVFANAFRGIPVKVVRS